MKKVFIEMHNGEKRNYEGVTRILDGQYKVKIYAESELLAMIDHGDIKNLLTEEGDE